MLARFKSKKQNILDALRKPSDEYEDLSPKGDLDAEVRDLIEEINSLPGYVTTSSCAGRVAVYLEGASKSKADPVPEGEEAASNGAASGGKGGGKWLFVSHEAVDLANLSASGAVYTKFGFSRTADISLPPSDTPVRYVHLKFEPMILHVLAHSAEDAQTLLGAGMSAGFRESGISGIVDSKGRPSMPMVAIRSSGLAMDCIIGFQPPPDPEFGAQRVQPMVSEEYLRAMIRISNDRFRTNIQRKERFRQSLLIQFAGSVPAGDDRMSDFRRRGGFQTASERKAEKRAEDMRKREAALERRAQALHRGGALDGAAENHRDEDAQDEELGFDALLDGEQDGCQ